MKSSTRIADVSCPRCGCYLVREFKCGCGAVHGDHCVNCGRFKDLAPGAYAELGEIDVRCTRGATPHEHSEKEKGERMAQYMQKLMQQKQRGVS